MRTQVVYPHHYWEGRPGPLPLEDILLMVLAGKLESIAEKEGMGKGDFQSLIKAMLVEGLIFSVDEDSVKRVRR